MEMTKIYSGQIETSCWLAQDWVYWFLFSCFVFPAFAREWAFQTHYWLCGVNIWFASVEWNIKGTPLSFCFCYSNIAVLWNLYCRCIILYESELARKFHIHLWYWVNYIYHSPLHFIRFKVSRKSAVFVIRKICTRVRGWVNCSLWLFPVLLDRRERRGTLFVRPV
jgi:hypothetical protein